MARIVIGGRRDKARSQSRARHIISAHLLGVGGLMGGPLSKCPKNFNQKEIASSPGVVSHLQVTKISLLRFFLSDINWSMY